MSLMSRRLFSDALKKLDVRGLWDLVHSGLLRIFDSGLLRIFDSGLLRIVRARSRTETYTHIHTYAHTLIIRSNNVVVLLLNAVVNIHAYSKSCQSVE